MAILLILGIVGGLAGLFADRAIETIMPERQRVVLGVIGGLVGGFLIRWLLPVAFGVLGAAAGAVLAIWLFQRYGRKAR